MISSLANLGDDQDQVTLILFKCTPYFWLQ